jgi:hypothetical protein
MIAATPTHFVLCAIYLYVFNSMHWVVGTNVYYQIKVEKAVKNMYKTWTDIINIYIKEMFSLISTIKSDLLKKKMLLKDIQ